jgi:sulfate adenylyltransferase subunit 1 (EFTu-like GTPase family)
LPVQYVIRPKSDEFHDHREYGGQVGATFKPGNDVLALPSSMASKVTGLDLFDKDIRYRLDVNTLHRDQRTRELALNEIGRVQLRTTAPLRSDPYNKNRTTGSLILVDEAAGVTVGARMISSATKASHLGRMVLRRCGVGQFAAMRAPI